MPALTNIIIIADAYSVPVYAAMILLQVINEPAKPNTMPVLKLIQLQYESDTWKRLLGFMMDENVHLKNRLAAVLKDGFNKELLDNVENFQTRFIKEDELIGLLRHDVAEIDKLLVKEIFEDGKIMKEIDRKLNRLRNNITDAEKKFGKLKLEFNNYLAENV